jgi:hypothetical protein
VAGGDHQFGAGIENLIPFGDQGLVALGSIQADPVEPAAAAAAIVVLLVGGHVFEIARFATM